MKNFQTMAKGAMNLAGWVWMALLMVQAAPGVHAEAVGNDIQKLLQSGKHPNLRWGKFSDVAKTLSQLYGQLEPVPLWVRDGQPTPQAKVMVEALARADDEGLNAVDYDAELLAKWLARKRATNNSNTLFISSR